MITLTTLTVLNILEYNIDEISEHLGKLPIDVIIKLKNKTNEIITQKNKTLVENINAHINDMKKSNKIFNGKADIDQNDGVIEIYLNIPGMRLLCIKINVDGRFYLRRFDIYNNNFVYDKYDSYLPDLLIKEFPTPWIKDFCEYLETIISEYKL